jgi:hypothetical protein
VNEILKAKLFITGLFSVLLKHFAPSELLELNHFVSGITDMVDAMRAELRDSDHACTFSAITWVIKFDFCGLANHACGVLSNGLGEILYLCRLSGKTGIASHFRNST